MMEEGYTRYENVTLEDHYYGYGEPFPTNGCIQYEDASEKTIMDSVEFQATMGFLYSLIWLLGTTSNALVLCVLLNESRKTRPWVSNRRVSSASSIGSSMATSAFFSIRFVFVACLACANLMTSVTLPVTSISIFTHQWIFPSFVCHVIGFFQRFSIFQSSFTFTSIAVDRYLLIFYPNRSVMTKRRAAIWLAFMAALSLLLSAPMAMFVRVVHVVVAEGVQSCSSYCIEEWPEGASFWDRRVYHTLVLILQFGLPATVTSLCYGGMAIRLRRLCNNPRRSELVTLNCDQAQRQSCASGALSALSTGTGASTDNGPMSSMRKEQRTNRMMLAMVVTFVLSWTPLNFLYIIQEFGLADHLHSQIFLTSYAIAHLFAMTSLIWNPVLYAYFNRPIRDALKIVLWWKWRETS